MLVEAECNRNSATQHITLERKREIIKEYGNRLLEKWQSKRYIYSNVILTINTNSIILLGLRYWKNRSIPFTKRSRILYLKYIQN
jgi:hypothetical protein